MPVNMWNGFNKYSLYGGGCGHSSVPAVSGLSSFLPSDDNFSLFLGAGLWEELSTGLSSETLFWNEPVRKKSRSKKVTDEKQNKQRTNKQLSSSSCRKDDTPLQKEGHTHMWSRRTIYRNKTMDAIQEQWMHWYSGHKTICRYHGRIYDEIQWTKDKKWVQWMYILSTMDAYGPIQWMKWNTFNI